MGATPTRTRDFQKRVRLTKEQELLLCRQCHGLPATTHRELSVWACNEFKLPRPPLSHFYRVLKIENTLHALTPDYLARKKQRPPYQLQLDQSVVEFVTECEDLQLSFSGEMVITQARRIVRRLHVPLAAQPRLGPSWLRNLQTRYAICWRRAYGEFGSVGLKAVATEFQRLRSVIGQYSGHDVYNMDKTGFFYNNVPRGSLCLHEAPALKQDTSRITLVLCCNAPGSDKVSLLFVGKAAKPRRIKNKPSGVDYKSAKKAWMTA